MYLFSPSTGGFYHEAVHGLRFHRVPDPDWKGAETDAGAVPPTIMVPNRECKIPPDAIIEVSDEEHAKLAGKRVVAGPGGYPIVKEVSAEERMDDLRLLRNAMLKETDWTQAADHPMAIEKRAEWAAYRQALRDLPATVKDLANIAWPEAPK